MNAGILGTTVPTILAVLGAVLVLAAFGQAAANGVLGALGVHDLADPTFEGVTGAVCLVAAVVLFLKGGGPGSE
jgi:hypothetical protein